MDRRLRALVFAALLGGASGLLACGGDANDQDDTNDERTTEQSVDESTPLDPPTQLEIPAAPKGTANADDARIANEVLLRFVGDRSVDAQHFAVLVEAGVLTLIPNEGADDEEIEAAKVLVASIDGLKDVRVEGQEAPVPEPDPGTQELVDAIDSAHEHGDVDETAEADDAETDDALDAPEAVEVVDDSIDVEAAAEIAEPAAEPHAQPDADEAMAEADTDADADAAAADADEPARDELRDYTLRRGDSLSIVAARELGNGARWTEIYELNRDTIGPNPERIRDGMVIKLPPRQ